MSESSKSLFSNLPSVDQLLQSVADLPAPSPVKTQVARDYLADLRNNPTVLKTTTRERIEADFQVTLAAILDPMRQVINATGVILHTGLGRAAYSPGMVQKLADLLSDGYVNLEFDLETGKRGDRNDHLRPWLRALTGAENGILVNNNAAAVLLALNTLANRKEVIISRGQLVEIGGSFRIPDILKKAGAKLVEVGTTNRTHRSDYESAINAKTKLLLWVHSSNYRIEGFTKEVSLAELVGIGKKHNLPVMADLGSGALQDISQYGLQREPLVSEIVKMGIDLVTFSVDKLLGGPQGGIIAGADRWIKSIEKNHLLRALRTDKTQILLTLEALRGYFDPETRIPFYRDIKWSLDALNTRANRILSRVTNKRLDIRTIITQGQVGSGASPTDTFQSVSLVLRHSTRNTKSLARALRGASTPVLGYIADDNLFLDIRTVRESQDDLLIRILNDLG